ncbi:MAG: GlsB/YeaQ/YmgE family stress response membrane protein [Acidobacteria bacterium]|nr:MAG: GlsB/YeaQ/YmgE family stress response membrane protein [Acidobacteriota bacterium]PIE91174.1 MAG: GlsB/YeaQ/YmgE family stress response membrane protein [Acidobacteriota bacterium]
MGILSWIVFGALAGWVANMIAGSSKKKGCVTNAAIGIVGAFLGGIIMNFINQRPYNFHFNLPSFGVAVLGAIFLLVITGASRR